MTAAAVSLVGRGREQQVDAADHAARVLIRCTTGAQFVPRIAQRRESHQVEVTNNRDSDLSHLSDNELRDELAKLRAKRAISDANKAERASFRKAL